MGVDPHRDEHALAVVDVVSGAVVFEATVAASSSGYAKALRLAAPIPASRPDSPLPPRPIGDRKLNRALHIILVTRKRTHPATIASIERRLAEGKTRREANRCLKRYLARNLYRLVESGASTAT